MDENSNLSKLKELLPIISSFSLLTTICPILIIWGYLKHIGRLEIFLESVSFSSLLIIIFIFFILSFSIFFIFIFIDSILLINIVYAYKESLLPHSKMKAKIVRVCFLNALSTNAWIFTLLAVFYKENSNILIILISGVTLAIITSYILSHILLLRDKHQIYGGVNINEQYLSKFSNRLLIPLILMIPALFLFIPLLSLTIQFKFPDNTSLIYQFVCLVYFSLAFTTFTLLPGALFINEYTRKKRLASVIITLIFLPAILFILSIFIPSLPFMIANTTLNWTGVNDWRTHQYSINNASLPHSMLPAVYWNTRTYQGLSDRYFISGVNAFTFGDIRLICPPKVLSIKNDFNKFSPFDTKENNQLNDKLKKLVMLCFTIEKGNIKQWDIPLPGQINFEKIRVPESPDFRYKVSKDELEILMLGKKSL